MSTHVAPEQTTNSTATGSVATNAAATQSIDAAGQTSDSSATSLANSTRSAELASSEDALTVVLALYPQGRLDEAIAKTKAAVERFPHHIPLLVALANYQQIANDFDAAEATLLRAMQADPHDPVACNAMAWLKATSPNERQRNGIEAIRLAEISVQASSRQNAAALDTLAAALAEAGRFDDAIRTQQQALEQLSAATEAESLDSVRVRRQLYKHRILLFEAGMPVRENSRVAFDLPMPRERPVSYREVLREYGSATEKGPDWPDQAYYLGWVLATHEDDRIFDRESATHIASWLQQLRSKRPWLSLDILAAVQARMGQVEEAFGLMLRAVELAEEAARDPVLSAESDANAALDGLRMRLQRYREGNDYREQSTLVFVPNPQRTLSFDRIRLAFLHYVVGQKLLEAGNVRNAVQWMRAAGRFDPSFAPAHAELGNLLWKQGDREEAVGHFLIADRCGHVDPTMLIRLGIFYRDRRRPKESLAEFRRALASLPDSIEVRNELALTLATCADSSLRNGKQAVELLEPLMIGANKADFSLLNSLAAAYAEVGRFDDAVRTAERASAEVESIRATVKPSELDEWQSRSVLYREQLSLYREHTPFHESADLMMERAKIALEQGRHADALPLIREAVRIKPSWIAAVNELAWQLANSKDPTCRRPAEALLVAESLAKATDRKHPLVLDTLAVAYAAVGRYPEAAQAVEEAYKILLKGPPLELISKVRDRLEEYTKRTVRDTAPSESEQKRNTCRGSDLER